MPLDNNISDLISQENLLTLAGKHSELCHGAYASLNGGASFEDVEKVLVLMLDQAEELSSILRLKMSLDCELPQSNLIEINLS